MPKQSRENFQSPFPEYSLHQFFHGGHAHQTLSKHNKQRMKTAISGEITFPGKEIRKS
jgi:hypothetical protein